MYPKLHEKIGELQKRFTTMDTLPVNDKKNQERLEVTYVLSDIVAIFYQPRFHVLVKSHVRKSSSKCSRLFTEISELCGETFVTKCVQNLTRVTDSPNNSNNNNNLYANAAKQTADENQKTSSLPLATDNVEVHLKADEPYEKVEHSLDCSVGRLSLTTKWRPKEIKNINILQNVGPKTRKDRKGSFIKSMRGVHKSHLVKKRKLRGVCFATIFL